MGTYTDNVKANTKVETENVSQSSATKTKPVETIVKETVVESAPVEQSTEKVVTKTETVVESSPKVNVKRGSKKVVLEEFDVDSYVQELMKDFITNPESDKKAREHTIEFDKRNSFCNRLMDEFDKTETQNVKPVEKAVEKKVTRKESSSSEEVEVKPISRKASNVVVEKVEKRES